MSSTFRSLGVCDAIVDRLGERGIVEPFPIQAATLEDALAGRDVCGRAPTGSGKTIAFGIPLIERVGKSRPKRPQGLVLVPTRELANQVADELEALAGRNGPSIVTIFGGVGFGPQLAQLRRGVDIAVACPGRLMDLINRGDMKLDDVSFVVIDEADRMADMGFLPEVKRILDMVREDRQTLLFSATLDGDVDELVRKYQSKPARHEMAVDIDAPQNEHVFWKVDSGSRADITAEVARKQWPAVVFCRTRHGADRLADRLAKMGVSAAAIHGDRSQRQREQALAQFTSGRVQALVATDVAARGIHVDDVACVVHFDPPQDEKDYVHRSGRTGRAGTTGLVISLVTGDKMGHVRRMQKILGRTETITGPDTAGLEMAPPPPARPAAAPKTTRISDLDKPARSGPSGKRYGGKPNYDGKSKPYGSKPAARSGDRTERTDRNDRSERTDRDDRRPSNERGAKPGERSDRQAAGDRWAAKPTERKASGDRWSKPADRDDRSGGRPSQGRPTGPAKARTASSDSAGGPRTARPVVKASTKAASRKRNGGGAGQIGAGHRGRRSATPR